MSHPCVRESFWSKDFHWLVPLFVSAFRRADELATAMECRCYHGGEGRTRLKVLRFATIDLIAFLVGALLLAGVIVLRHFGL